MELEPHPVPNINETRELAVDFLSLRRSHAWVKKVLAALGCWWNAEIKKRVPALPEVSQEVNQWLIETRGVFMCTSSSNVADLHLGPKISGVLI